MNGVGRDRFSKTLMRWWENNARTFPWRRTRDPYHIIIAEVFLHRTRAKQVVPVYENFLKKFPNLRALSHASPLEIETMLRPLGLRWRVTLLIIMVKEIMEKYKGVIPSEKNQLESLPGVSH